MGGSKLKIIWAAALVILLTLAFTFMLASVELLVETSPTGISSLWGEGVLSRGFGDMPWAGGLDGETPGSWERKETGPKENEGAGNLKKAQPREENDKPAEEAKHLHPEKDLDEGEKVGDEGMPSREDLLKKVEKYSEQEDNIQEDNINDFAKMLEGETGAGSREELPADLKEWVENLEEEEREALAELAEDFSREGWQDSEEGEPKEDTGMPGAVEEGRETNERENMPSLHEGMEGISNEEESWTEFMERLARQGENESREPVEEEAGEDDGEKESVTAGPGEDGGTPEDRESTVSPEEENGGRSAGDAAWLSRLGEFFLGYLLPFAAGLLALFLAWYYRHNLKKLASMLFKGKPGSASGKDKAKVGYPMTSTGGKGGITREALLEFPQIESDMPEVWGVGEPLTVKVVLQNGEAFMGSELYLRCAGQTIHLDNSFDQTAEVEHVFHRKGAYSVDVFCGSRLLASRSIRIVNYREEVIDLGREMLQNLTKESREVLLDNLTPREIIRALPEERKYTLDRRAADRCIDLFERAAYGLETVRRSFYRQFFLDRSRLDKPSSNQLEEAGR